MTSSTWTELPLLRLTILPPLLLPPLLPILIGLLLLLLTATA